ncbi:MAG: HAMP domain-containing sensor histidine kinase [Candidatus Izemoplasmatales bacterium]|nr:HAMP domain-containing sensor histidine kinase [Candidatus Izemoplasmatales bacterium]
MTSFKSFFKQRTVKFFVIVFASFLLLSNIAVYGLSKYQYEREQKRQLDNYKVMMVHLITMESEEIAITYTEHFYHTQGIFIAYYDQLDNLVYVTPEAPKIDERINLYDGDVLLGKIIFDSQNSILGNELSYGLIILNSFSFILFLVFLQLLYWYLNSWYNLLEKDLLHIGKKGDGFNFSDLEAVSIHMLELIESERRIREYQKEYVKVLAHDIKTPLTVIRAYVEGMALGKIEYSLDVMNDLINEVKVLDKMVPKFMQQSSDFKQTNQNIKPVIESVISRLNEVFKTKKIEVSYEIDDYDLKISYIDISRIVENLLFNAFHYTDNLGKIRIKLNADNDSLVISDNGIGMDEETYCLIKQGPYRSEEAYLYNKKGSGMGLQIVFEIVERLGYKIDFETKVNVGTTVKISFK